MKKSIKNCKTSIYVNICDFSFAFLTKHDSRSKKYPDDVNMFNQSNYRVQRMWQNLFGKKYVYVPEKRTRYACTKRQLWKIINKKRIVIAQSAERWTRDQKSRIRGLLDKRATWAPDVYTIHWGCNVPAHSLKSNTKLIKHYRQRCSLTFATIWLWYRRINRIQKILKVLISKKVNTIN